MPDSVLLGNAEENRYQIDYAAPSIERQYCYNMYTLKSLNFGLEFSRYFNQHDVYFRGIRDFYSMRFYFTIRRTTTFLARL